MQHLSEHRDLLLRAVIDDHLSYSYNKTSTLDRSRIPMILELIKTHQLLHPQDSPTAFSTPIATPTKDDPGFQALKSHRQTIEKFISCTERLITSKGIFYFFFASK